MILSTQQLKLISKYVEQALNFLYEKDLYLIQNEVHERTIVGRFAIYLQQQLNKSKFKGFNLDIEYNRNFSDRKRTVNSTHITYPDLILHSRGNNEENICIFEFKTWWNNNISDDISKLRDFTRQTDEYKYGVGYSILLNRSRESVEKIVLKNGELIDE